MCMVGKCSNGEQQGRVDAFTTDVGFHRSPGIDVNCDTGFKEANDVISDKMRHLDGIVATETMIAFRAYSKKDLEAGFELGLD